MKRAPAMPSTRPGLPYGAWLPSRRLPAPWPLPTTSPTPSRWRPRRRGPRSAPLLSRSPRADMERQTLRVLVNVGVLAEGEVRFPTHEEYPFHAFPAVETLLLKGEPYLSCADDPNEDPDDRRMAPSHGPQLRARSADRGRRRGVGRAVGGHGARRRTAQRRRHRVPAGRRAVRCGRARARGAPCPARAAGVRRLADRPRQPSRAR